MTAASEAARAGVVIVGAGQAGGRAAETLRAEKFLGPITLIGEETERPYERPSLSKEMLLDPSRETIAWLHEPDFYAAQDITLRLGTTVVAIDRATREVQLSDGSSVPYGILLLSTGADVRRLDVPGGDAGCHYVRSLQDSRALRHRFVAGTSVLVVGAGFIGLEVAAAAIARGCAVTVIEVGPAPLGRVAPSAVRDFYRTLHEARGVTFRFDTQVSGVVPAGKGQRVHTSGGETFDADVVVVGIGAIPRTELAATAGLACDRGILVDAYGQTDDRSIFAAGDVAQHFNPLIGQRIVLESWQNAQNQAIAIARNLAQGGEPTPYAEWPWFWSDQYDVNLQIYGLARAGSQEVVRGTPGNGSWLMFQLNDGRITFAAGINAARDLRATRELMKLRMVVDPAELADPTMGLADTLRRARAVVAA